jgi:hypothetical protein
VRRDQVIAAAEWWQDDDRAAGWARSMSDDEALSGLPPYESDPLRQDLPIVREWRTPSDHRLS